MNRYICGHVEQYKCCRVDLNGYHNESLKMNRYIHEWVHLWAGTQVVVKTGRPLWLDGREA